MKVYSVHVHNGYRYAHGKRVLHGRIQLIFHSNVTTVYHLQFQNKVNNK